MRIRTRSRFSRRQHSKIAQKRPPRYASYLPLCINELTEAQRERILRLVREGLTFRSIERITGHRRETISRYVRRETQRAPEVSAML